MKMKPLTADYAVMLNDDSKSFDVKFRTDDGDILILKSFEKDKYELIGCDCYTVDSKPSPFNQRIMVNVFEPRKGEYHLFRLQPFGERKKCGCSKTKFTKSNKGFYYTDGFLYDPRTDQKLDFNEELVKKATENGIPIGNILIEPLTDDEKCFTATFSLGENESLSLVAAISTLNQKQFKLSSSVYAVNYASYMQCVTLTSEKQWLTAEEWLEKLLQSPLADEIKSEIQKAQTKRLAKTRNIRTRLAQIIEKTKEEE